MTGGIAAAFVDVRVQALEIVVEDAFVAFHVWIELVGVGTSAEEGVARIERSRGLVRLQEGPDGGIGGASTRPLTFPDQSDELVEKVVFLLAKGEDVVHGTTEEPGMRFMALQKTGRQPCQKHPSNS